MARDVLEAPEFLPPSGSNAAPTVAEAEPRIVVASQWQLMWRKFRKHRLAMISLTIVGILYFVAFFAGFFAPQATDSYSRRYTQAPPQTIHWLDNGTFAPFVYGYKQTTDPNTYKRTYVVDEKTKIPLGFFVHGDEYEVGLHGIPLPVISDLHITSDIHLFGAIKQGDPFYSFGADDVGRDVFSRMIYAAQVSLSIGLIGVFLSLLLGVFLGGISGLVGG